MNFSSLPDSVAKLLTLIGLAMIIWSTYSFLNARENYEKQRIDFNKLIHTLNNERDFLKRELKDINEDAETYSKKMALPNPLVISDSGYTFTITYRGNSNVVVLSDTISHLLEKYKSKRKEIDTKDADLSVQRYALDETGKSFNELQIFLGVSFVLGIFSFWGGFLLWDRSEVTKDSILSRQHIGLPTFSNNCQSCGRKFDSIIKRGTEADLSTNYHYCNECFSNGNFSDPSLTIGSLMLKINANATPRLSKREKRKTEKYLRGLDRWKKRLF